VSDIDTVAVDSLKALDPKWPIREADIDEPAKSPGTKVQPLHICACGSVELFKWLQTQL
jgi:hypothetical protein